MSRTIKVFGVIWSWRDAAVRLEHADVRETERAWVSDDKPAVLGYKRVRPRSEGPLFETPEEAVLHFNKACDEEIERLRVELRNLMKAKKKAQLDLHAYRAENRSRKKSK